MSRSSKEVIAILNRDDWFRVRQNGSHIQFKHPTKPGRITVNHPVKDMKIGTLKEIERVSGLRLRR